MLHHASFPSTEMITPPSKKQKNGTEATIKHLREAMPPFNGVKFSKKSTSNKH
jgi:hypothetical protein